MEEIVRGLFATFAVLLALSSVAYADEKKEPNAGTGKGAAVGAAAGHEIGSGHALSGAAAGAAVGHHEKSKANSSAAK